MGVLEPGDIFPLVTASEGPLTVAAATDAETEAEAARGPAAERAEDPKKRRRPNRLAVSPQNRAMSIAVKTVRKVMRISLRPLIGLGALCVCEVFWLGSEDIYGSFEVIEQCTFFFLRGFNSQAI